MSKTKLFIPGVAMETLLSWLQQPWHAGDVPTSSLLYQSLFSLSPSFPPSVPFPHGCFFAVSLFPGSCYFCFWQKKDSSSSSPPSALSSSQAQALAQALSVVSKCCRPPQDLTTHCPTAPADEILIIDPQHPQLYLCPSSCKQSLCNGKEAQFANSLSAYEATLLFCISILSRTTPSPKQSRHFFPKLLLHVELSEIL